MHYVKSFVAYEMHYAIKIALFYLSCLLVLFITLDDEYSVTWMKDERKWSSLTLALVFCLSSVLL